MAVGGDSSNSMVAMGIAALAILAGSGCAKMPAAEAPNDSGRTNAKFAQAPSDDPLAQLDELERQMRTLDLPVAASRLERERLEESGTAGAGGDFSDSVSVDDDEARDQEGETEDLAAANHDVEPTTVAAEESPNTPVPAPGDGEGGQCLMVCDLQDAICGLEEQICSLAAAHGEDPLYADACDRAQEDCETASGACQGCE